MTAVLDPQHPPHRIIVFRALQLGDMLCAVPAFRAVRQAFPRAQIVLAGLPGAREFVDRFHAYVDELTPFPGDPAFPEQKPDEAALPEFFDRIRAWQPDVALQLHGSGRQSNEVVRQFGARQWAGFVPDASEEVPGARLAWPDHLPEVLRYLALLRFAGLENVHDEHLEFPCSHADERDAIELMRQWDLDPRRLVLIHVGARLASRRWPLARFADLARGLHQDGWQIALTGTTGESAMTTELQQLAQVPLTDLSGLTNLGSLAALVRASRLLVCNDTGISHVAAAMQAPSVVVACGSDTRRWAPLNRRRHRVLSADVPCRPCAHPVCPIGHPCALQVTAPEVLAAARDQLYAHERVTG
ncbi:glycosyltransferase family 9 protein [Bordetella genomosp. 4]|uniref:LPS biosynthesis glycosyltransferase n=1 Tax=Bordetella genomosp. 4 TaxID=463044 RepID=A0A261U3C3_9BORD|nr:glycosyltransferase family 9 protein [Bordetella genomosp. 4]OZI56115.1 LPS biosynthesis glycosyltransferase [Bordetella genomosp. 4]